MYTIKQASTRSGVSIPTIRVWERRYGVVSPTRTAAGYRLYDDESIARLRAMRQLIDLEGWRPSQAAQRIVAGGTDPAFLAAIAAESGTRVDSVDTGEGGGFGDAIDSFIDAARRLDMASMERALDDAFAAQRFEAVMDRVVFPALRAVGDAWAAGDIDVAREHAASETIRRRVARYFDAAGVAGGPRVLIGLPPGSHHDLGAFAFAVAARRAGLDVVYLGADVPLESWPRTIHSIDPVAVVLAVATPTDVDAARTVIDLVRSADAPPIVAVGGPAAAALADDANIDLAGSIEAGITALMRRLAGPSTPVETAAV